MKGTGGGPWLGAYDQPVERANQVSLNKPKSEPIPKTADQHADQAAENGVS